ncbi:Dihydrolipoyllysine-residue succinyltransferase component of 2-oxoglutarate dehydrogenase complex 2, mitochondrial [Linum perenne]
MVGGSFTISNGGVYGSLLSTPIINPPNSVCDTGNAHDFGRWWKHCSKAYDVCCTNLRP